MTFNPLTVSSDQFPIGTTMNILTEEGVAKAAVVGAASGGGGGHLSNVFFVDAGAAAPGDGSLGTPFQTIAAGMAALVPLTGGTLLVAPNSYIEDPVVVPAGTYTIECLGSQNQTTLPAFEFTSAGGQVRLTIKAAAVNGGAFTVTAGNQPVTVELQDCNAATAAFSGTATAPLVVSMLDCFAPGVTGTQLLGLDVDGGSFDGTLSFFNFAAIEMNLRDVKVASLTAVTFTNPTGVVNVDATANFWWTTTVSTIAGGTKVIQASVV